jgi:AcrR family transcriptional regulator
VTVDSGKDGRTRRRLVEVATRLFAERGFKHVTVRAICQEARANVAAVNYHFRDKLSLYREVLDEAVSVVASLAEEAIRAGAGLPAEGKLRAYVKVHTRHIFRHGSASVLQQLLHREFQDPTKALESLIDRVWRPRFAYLTGIVGELLDLPPGDPQVIRCAISIHLQVIMIRPSPAMERMEPKAKRVFTARAVADHIASFSLAGLDAYRQRR